MKRKQLILLHILLILSFPMIFVLGPYYRDYLVENFEIDYENPEKYSFTGLNFSFQQEHVLLTPTFLNSSTIVIVDFNSTQPIYVIISQYSLLPLYEKSIYRNESGVLTYQLVASDEYIITAKAFNGAANVTVFLVLSNIILEKPYVLWGQLMYYGGIGLLVGGITFTIVTWFKKRRQLPKQPPKTTTKKEKSEKKLKRRF